MKRGYRPRSERMVAVNARIAERIRQHSIIDRLGFKFPIVADPATGLPADRKNAKASSHGSRERRSDLSAGPNSGEGN